MIKEAQLLTLSDRFYSGKYKEVLVFLGKKALDEHHKNFLDFTAFQIGAMVFLGEVEEASILFERAIKFNKTSDELFNCRCRFFLGIGCVRRSEYQRASKYFAQNVSAKKKLSPHQGEALFYIYQGSSFYRFFKGQYQKSMELAELSYTWAFESQFEYGQVLSLDLLGHSLCQTGSIRRGLYEFERAHALAQKIGNGGLVSALLISEHKYRAQFGIDLKNTLKNLRNALFRLSPEDTYSMAELYLELIRQLVLRGKGKEAQLELEKVGPIIYKNRHKRQTAIFNLRCAHLLLLRGEAHAALALISTLRMNLDPKIDLDIESQAAGLLEKINSTITGEPFLNSQNVAPVSFMDGRILARRKREQVSIANLKEDPLGDILDSAHNEKLRSFYELKEQGLWGVIPSVLEIPLGSSAVFLGPSRNELVVVRGSEVLCIDSAVTVPMKKLLLNLSGAKFKSKEWLVKKTWNYEYDPFIHDRLLHATIAKIRKVLGPFAYFIEWESVGYRLLPEVKLYESVMNAKEQVHDPIVKRPGTSESLEGDLNMRQIKTLRSLKSGDYIGVSEYALRFKVTTMTASRDLSSLHKRGLLIRVGRARATVYGVNEGVL